MTLAVLFTLPGDLFSIFTLPLHSLQDFSAYQHPDLLLQRHSIPSAVMESLLKKSQNVHLFLEYKLQKFTVSSIL